MADMTCAELVQVVTDYFEGAMPPDDRARFEEHVAICEGCEAFLDQMRTTIQLTGRLDEESIGEETRDRLLEAFRGWNLGGRSRV
jgi:predicted anti-sigma-YlaC factor YlaD